jgi:hypothetical protein
MTEGVSRSDWEAIAHAFGEFFGGCGATSVTDLDLTFDGRPRVATGLVLRRDGTSTSFMPLHGLEARWDAVRFDADGDEVVLMGDGVSYTYRLPPALRRSTT